ncbi:hypothetical protein L1887_01238 [Cichorium endivia]|nr:hypothetical protein L1887_01238 [Cichorium endivia]
MRNYLLKKKSSGVGGVPESSNDVGGKPESSSDVGAPRAPVDLGVPCVGDDVGDERDASRAPVDLGVPCVAIVRDEGERSGVCEAGLG